MDSSRVAAIVGMVVGSLALAWQVRPGARLKHELEVLKLVRELKLDDTFVRQVAESRIETIYGRELALKELLIALGMLAFSLWSIWSAATRATFDAVAVVNLANGVLWALVAALPFWRRWAPSSRWGKLKHSKKPPED